MVSVRPLMSPTTPKTLVTIGYFRVYGIEFSVAAAKNLAVVLLGKTTRSMHADERKVPLLPQ
jgi:hypothetical protein